MFYHILMFIWDFGLDVLAVSRLTADAKDLEILLLRQQLRIVDRKQQRGPVIPRWQKVALVVLVMRLKAKAVSAKATLAESLRLFKPETVLGWHRELVRRKWTFKPRQQPGRPPIDLELEHWIVQLARENPRLGYDKLEGECRKLGFGVSATTIRTILLKHRIPPLPERTGSSWQTFLRHYQKQFLACDFFTVETLTVKTLYVLFFIEHATRQVYFAGCTAHPDANWVVQQARQLTWELEARNPAMRYLIHDHDSKFTLKFDAIFESQSIDIVATPFRAPNANAFAERWVRTVREECLDHLIILNEQHLRRVMNEYTTYYNLRRPHQSLAQASPLGFSSEQGEIRCRTVLGGILRDYYREAA